VRGDIFRTCPDRHRDPPSLLYNGYRFFHGREERPGRDADPSPLLMPWSRKGTAISLLTLWTVRPYRASVPVQGCTLSCGLYTASVPVQGCTLPYGLYRASVPVQGRTLPYGLYRASVPVQEGNLPFLPQYGTVCTSPI
jgi:hypothetical protein